MRLALAFPPPWRLSTAPNDRVAAVLPGASVPDAVVTYGPIIVAPDEPRAWREQVARADVPAGARVVLGRAGELVTGDGWPLRVLGAEVHDAAGALIEVRLCGFFAFLEHAAAVVARTQTAAKMEVHAKGIMRVLLAGRPDWRGVEPACLARVWDLNLARRGARDDAATTDDDAAALARVVEDCEREIAGAPDRADAYYDLGQARLLAADPAGALAAFQRVLTLEPQAIFVLRKVAQCLFALGRDDEGEAQRARLRAAYAASMDPRVRLVDEYVFDQFEVGGQRVMAVETLRPRDPAYYTMLAFRAERGPSVVIETSDHAKSAGAPFVLGVTDGGTLRVVATLTTLPPYPELKRTAIELMLSPPTPPA